MASILSDSSEEDDEQYTTTNVMLGYASKEPTDDTISQLGGFPTWLDNQPPSASLAKCKTCSSVMVLLLQLNGDLPEYFPCHERRLYVFACRNKSCRRKPGTIRAIRGTKIAPSSRKDFSQSNHVAPSPTVSQSKPPFTNLGDSIFKSNGQKQFPSNANPFSTSQHRMNANPFSTSAAANPIPYGHQRKQPFTLPTNPPHTSEPTANITDNDQTSTLPQTFAQKARITSPPPPSSKPPATPSPPTPFPSPSLLPTPYPTYHLSADYETLDLSSPSASPRADLFQSPSFSKSESTVEPNEDDDPKSWLSPTSRADTTFLRFAARLAQNPEQVLRYEFGGRPLLYSRGDGDEVGRAFPSPSSTHPSNNKITTASTTTKIDTTIGAVTSAGNNNSNIPKCENCGQGRVFEFQLTPHAISELEAEDDEVGMEGMEWGTVVVGVCAGDCFRGGSEGDYIKGDRGEGEGKVTWLEEWVGVSWED